MPREDDRQYRIHKPSRERDDDPRRERRKRSRSSSRDLSRRDEDGDRNREERRHRREHDRPPRGNQGNDHRRGNERIEHTRRRDSPTSSVSKQQTRPVKTESNDSNRDQRPPNAPPSNSKPVAEKQKPTFALSGKLAEDTNTFNGVVIKYIQPPEAKIPKRKWRLYPFKGDESLPFIPIHTQSAFLLGRDRKVADIPIDHPSCSSQHAVMQYRVIPYERADGSKGRKIRPYIIDLDSSNGTFLNNKRIESRKYYEIFDKDVLKFGFSSRDYVVMHEDYSEKDEDV